MSAETSVRELLEGIGVTVDGHRPSDIQVHDGAAGFKIRQRQLWQIVFSNGGLPETYHRPSLRKA